MHRGCFVWMPTPPLRGRRKPRLGPARVCVSLPILAGPGGRASRARSGAPHFSFARCRVSFISRPLPGWGCPCFGSLLSCLLFCFLIFSIPCCASRASGFLWFAALGALGLGAVCSLLLRPSAFPYFLFLSPSASQLSLAFRGIRPWLPWAVARCAPPPNFCCPSPISLSPSAPPLSLAFLGFWPRRWVAAPPPIFVFFFLFFPALIVLPSLVLARFRWLPRPPPRGAYFAGVVNLLRVFPSSPRAFFFWGPVGHLSAAVAACPTPSAMVCVSQVSSPCRSFHLLLSPISCYCAPVGRLLLLVAACCCPHSPSLSFLAACSPFSSVLVVARGCRRPATHFTLFSLRLAVACTSLGNSLEVVAACCWRLVSPALVCVSRVMSVCRSFLSPLSFCCAPVGRPLLVVTACCCPPPPFHGLSFAAACFPFSCLFVFARGCRRMLPPHPPSWFVCCPLCCLVYCGAMVLPVALCCSWCGVWCRVVPHLVVLRVWRCCALCGLCWAALLFLVW